MIGSPAVQWLLTAVFLAAGLAVTLPLMRPAARSGLLGSPEGLSTAFCPVMCAALIAMIWWSEPSPATWLQASVFGCATVCFGAAAAVQVRRSRRAGMTGLHYMLMAGSMIWMLDAMPATSTTQPATDSRMAMQAMSPAVMSIPVVAVGVLLAAYFVITAVSRLAWTLDSGYELSRVFTAGHAAMNAGMAVMMIVML